MRNDYCVYYHLDIEGVVRYVGSGSLKRPSRRSNRNAEWHRLFDQSPFKVELVKTGLTRTEALDLETELISVNLTTVVNKKQSSDKVRELRYEELSELFEISESSPSGLVWKVRSGRWGRYPVGSVAGSLGGKPNKRYWAVNTKSGCFAVHRIVYLLAIGSICPVKVINHIDGDSTNNKISNLEQVSQSHNVYKVDKVYGEYGRNITVRYHKGNPMSVVAKFSFTPNTESQKNFGVRACGSLENAVKLAQEWRLEAEKSLQLNLSKEEI